MNKLDILVLGGGAWGTALAVQADRAGARAGLWLRDPAQAAALRAGRVSPHLPGVALAGGIAVLDAIVPAPLVLIATPAQSLRQVSALVPDGAEAVVCAKGIELHTGLLPLAVLAQVRPGLRGAVLSGPNFAHEVAAGMPAAAVVGSQAPALRDAVAARLGTPAFRLYGNDDPVGVQVGGAAKNVIAIAAGVVTGAGLGENARAALITRGLAELSRLALALGGRAETIAGLSGLGDLLLTCTGPASRNFALGLAMGRGETLAAGLAQSAGVAEGVATAAALRQVATGLDLPICREVARLLAGETAVRAAIAGLLARPRKDE